MATLTCTDYIKPANTFYQTKSKMIAVGETIGENYYEEDDLTVTEMRKLSQMQHRIRPYSAVVTKGLKPSPPTTETTVRKTSLPHINLEHAQLQSAASRTASKSTWNLGLLMNNQTTQPSTTGNVATTITTSLRTKPRSYTLDHQRARNMEALLDQCIRPRASSLETRPVQPKVELSSHQGGSCRISLKGNDFPTTKIDPAISNSSPFDLPRLRINSYPESTTTISCSPPKAKSLKGLYGGPNQPIQNRRKRSLVAMRKASSFDT